MYREYDDDWRHEADFDAAQEWWDAQEEPPPHSLTPDMEPSDDASDRSTDSAVARASAAEAHYYDTIVRPREELQEAYHPSPPPLSPPDILSEELPRETAFKKADPWEVAAADVASTRQDRACVFESGNDRRAEPPLAALSAARTAAGDVMSHKEAGQTVLEVRTKSQTAVVPAGPSRLDSNSVAGVQSAWHSANALTDEGEYMCACDQYEMIEETHCAYYWRYVYDFREGVDGTQSDECALMDWSRRNRELRIEHQMVGPWARQQARWGLLPKVVA